MGDSEVEGQGNRSQVRSKLRNKWLLILRGQSVLNIAEKLSSGKDFKGRCVKFSLS